MCVMPAIDILIITTWNARNLLRILVGNGWIGRDGTSFIHMYCLHSSVISSDTRCPHSTVIMCQQRSEENSAFIITNLVRLILDLNLTYNIPLNQFEKKQPHLSLSWFNDKNLQKYPRGSLLKKCDNCPTCL